MKLLHLADLHIGKHICDFDLLEDQQYLLQEVLNMAEIHSVDGILIAGDVYDKPIPSEAAVKLFNRFLSDLAKRGIQTFIISGNHDSDERLNFGSSLFTANGIYITAKYEGTLSKVTLTDEYGPIHIYSLPFVKASQVRHLYPDEKIETYEDAFRTIFSHAKVDESERNILISHQFVAGHSTDPVLGGSEGLSVQAVGLVEKIGYDLFSMFDYTALGHIHSPQSIGNETVRYAGSLMKYSLNEASSHKSVPLITMGEKGDISIELLPLIPKRDLRHIKGTHEQLLSPESITDPDDLIYVTLTDEEILSDAMGLFQQYYPNTLKIDYENSHTKFHELEEFQVTEETVDFSTLMAQFYESIYGTEISSDELEIVKDAAREAGVYHEAD